MNMLPDTASEWVVCVHLHTDQDQGHSLSVRNQGGGCCDREWLRRVVGEVSVCEDPLNLTLRISALFCTCVLNQKVFQTWKENLF